MMVRKTAATLVRIKAPTEPSPQSRKPIPRSPRALVAGSQDFVVRKVARCLDQLAVRVEAMHWEELLDRIDSTVAAIVVAHPVAKIGDRGLVRLSGSIQNRRALLRLETLISHLKGVRGIECAVTISMARQQEDSRLAQRLRKSLSRLYPRERIQLKVVVGTVVLTGRVRLLATKRSIERLLKQDNAVQRVVNKIEVKRGK